MVLVFFTFPPRAESTWLFNRFRLAMGCRSAWYSLKTRASVGREVDWREQIQLARATASWMADNAPAPPDGFNYSMDNKRKLIWTSIALSIAAHRSSCIFVCVDLAF